MTAPQAVRVRTADGWQDIAIQGASGADGADGSAGPPGLTWKGAWNAATAYVVNDAVTNDGSSYRRTVAGTTSASPSLEWTPEKAMTWVADGDTNGAIYYLGVLTGGGTFTKPATGNSPTATGTHLNVTFSPGYYGTGNGAQEVVDRTASTGLTSQGSAGDPPYMLFDFKTRRLAPDMLSLKDHGYPTWRAVGFALEGSHDNVVWTSLLDVANSGLTANTWGHWPVTSSVAYRYLRIKATTQSAPTGWYLGFAEVDFYGAFYGSALQNWEPIALKGAAGSAGASGSVEVYNQPGQPATPGVGAIWIDTDADPPSALAGVWHKVGSVGEPAFGAPWVQPAAGQPQLQFRKMADGVVRLRGKTNASSTFGWPTTLFTLPAGFRPVQLMTFVTLNLDSNSTFNLVRTNIDTDGTIKLVGNVAGSASSGGTNSQHLLDGVTFDTD